MLHSFVALSSNRARRHLARTGPFVADTVIRRARMQIGCRSIRGPWEFPDAE